MYISYVCITGNNLFHNVNEQYGILSAETVTISVINLGTFPAPKL